MTDSSVRHSHTLEEIVQYIMQEDEFLITTHINPDGDSLTSILVFASILRQLNKIYTVVLDDPIPVKFQFLPDIEKVLTMEKLGMDKVYKNVVVLDASNLDRIGDTKSYIQENTRVINIDHHPGNTEFGEFFYIDPDQSSTVELVHQLYQIFELPLNLQIAELIYTGIVCDTGCFRYSNTNAQSLEVSAEMVRLGAVPSKIIGQLQNQHSDHTLRALGRAFSRIEFDFNERVVGMSLNQNDLRDYPSTDTEGFVNYLLMIQDTQVQYFVKEVAPNCHRVSFRSRCDVDVNKIASQFKGGGHATAAGCFIEGSLSDVRRQVVEKLTPYFESVL